MVTPDRQRQVSPSSMRMAPMYQYSDAAVIRGTAWPSGLQVPRWPDLTGQQDPGSWRVWLRDILDLPGFAAALDQASPALAGRVHEICAGHRVSDRDTRRAVVAVVQYLLRA